MATITIHTCWHRVSNGRCQHCGGIYLEVPPWQVEPGDDVWGEDPHAGTFLLLRAPRP